MAEAFVFAGTEQGEAGLLSGLGSSFLPGFSKVTAPQLVRLE